MENNDGDITTSDNGGIGRLEVVQPSPVLSPVLIRTIFLLLGVGILIPWNAFVSAKPYFQARLCQDGAVIIDFELWFGLVWNLSSVISLGLIIASVSIKDSFFRQSDQNSNLSTNGENLASESQSRNSGSTHDSRESTGSHHTGHSLWLVMVPLSLFLIVFSITDLLVLVPNIDPHLFMVLTLAGLALCGTCGAIATAGIISTAGLFESHLGIAPFFSGQALGGVAVSVANFVAATMEDSNEFLEENCQVIPTNETDNILYFDDFDGVMSSSINRRLVDDMLTASSTCSPYDKLDWAVFGYFFAGCVVLACCLAGYTVINKFQQQVHRDDYVAVHDVEVVPSQPELLDESPRIGLEMKSQRSGEDHLDSSTTRSYHDNIDPKLGTMTMNSTEMRSSENVVSEFEDELSVEPEEYTEEENELAVFSAVKGPWTCVFLVFSLTLCMFPSWISELRSVHQCQSHSRLHNDLYVPLSFVIFNVGDLCGRVLSEKVPITHISNLSTKLVLLALGRLVIFPILFLMCLTQEQRHWIPLIANDFYSLMVQFFFALTNGLLVSVSFMHSPHLVAHNTGMQERASEMMTFAVSFGLLTGSFLSFPFTSLAIKL